jgi:hypothetical protein
MLSWESCSTETVRKVAERVPFPHPRRRAKASTTDPTKPVLVRGRGLGRRPRSPLLSLFAALLVLAGLVALILL